MAVRREDFPAFGNLTHENLIFREIFQLKWTNMLMSCFCSHPTRPRSAISLRSSLNCLTWPLLGSNAEYREPPGPPFATNRRSPSVFRSPWREEWKVFLPQHQLAIPLPFDYFFCIVSLTTHCTKWGRYYKRRWTYQVLCHHQWWLWYQQEPGSPCPSLFLLSALGHCQ